MVATMVEEVVTVMVIVIWVGLELYWFMRLIPCEIYCGRNMHQHQLARKRLLVKKSDCLELLAYSKEQIHIHLLSFLRTYDWGWESRKVYFRAWCFIPPAIQPAEKTIRRTIPLKEYIRNTALSCLEARKKRGIKNNKLGERRKVSYLIPLLISFQFSHFLAQIHWGYMDHAFHLPVTFPTTPQFIGPWISRHSFQAPWIPSFLPYASRISFE